MNKSEDIDRLILNEAWRQGGVEGVAKLKKYFRTCDECGHEHEVEEWIECALCSSSQLRQQMNAITAATARMRSKRKPDSESTP